MSTFHSKKRPELTGMVVAAVAVAAVVVAAVAVTEVAAAVIVVFTNEA